MATTTTTASQGDCADHEHESASQSGQSGQQGDHQGDHQD
jgi:hypothetical protein